MTSLLDPVRLGDLTLNNRVVMAPSASARPALGRIPNDTMRVYYARRASAGLIITEDTSVSPLGVGYPDTPGIWSSAHVRGWQAVTDAVHERGGRILLRLWHAGRVSDPEYLNGEMPVAPSPIACCGNRDFVVPRTLHTDEIRRIVADFDQAAHYARQAGFDGVQIQAGDGYLIDQFLHDGANHRQDEYGGPVAHRCRFLLEIVDACIGVWGAGRVGVHLSPRGDRHDMTDSDPAGLYSYVAQELGQRRVAFICTRERPGPDALAPVIRKAFGGPMVLNEGYDIESARRAIESGQGDAVAFGKAFVSTPDLVQRLVADRAFQPADLPQALAG